MSRLDCDVLVIGAGPAGALAARQLAREGLAVTLVDRSAFPRTKVCGSCLSPLALSTLASVGLGSLVQKLGAAPIRSMRLATSRREADLPTPGMAVLSRETLDAGLVEAACQANVNFLSRTQARWKGTDSECSVFRLTNEDGFRDLRTRIVVVAAGLNGVLGAEKNGRPTTSGRSPRIGVGVILDQAPALYETGRVYMAVGSGGYLGLARLEDGRLDAAAAWDPKWLRQAGGAGSAASHLLAELGWPAIPELISSVWKGTPTLTRRPAHVAEDRLFRIGDAAGYVEPFTGEGIGWALASALAVTPIVAGAARNWQPRWIHEWCVLHWRLIGRRQRLCRFLAWCLRRPRLVNACLGVCGRWPGMVSPLIRHLAAKKCGGPRSLEVRFPGAYATFYEKQETPWLWQFLG